MEPRNTRLHREHALVPLPLGPKPHAETEAISVERVLARAKKAGGSGVGLLWRRKPAAAGWGWLRPRQIPQESVIRPPVETGGKKLSPDGREKTLKGLPANASAAARSWLRPKQIPQESVIRPPVETGGKKLSADGREKTLKGLPAHASAAAASCNPASR